MSNRKRQQYEAKERYIAIRKAEGWLRLDTYISKDAWKILVEGCEKFDLSRANYLNQLLLGISAQKHEGLERSKSVNSNFTCSSCECTYEKLIKEIERLKKKEVQLEYWSERYQKLLEISNE